MVIPDSQYHHENRYSVWFNIRITSDFDGILYGLIYKLPYTLPLAETMIIDRVTYLRQPGCNRQNNRCAFLGILYHLSNIFEFRCWCPTQPTFGTECRHCLLNHDSCANITLVTNLLNTQSPSVESYDTIGWYNLCYSSSSLYSDAIPRPRFLK